VNDNIPRNPEPSAWLPKIGGNERTIVIGLGGQTVVFEQPAALVFVIPQRMPALLHFLSTGFATIEVKEDRSAASGRTQGTGSNSVSF
jgi:hypothetical protein